jgi:hypothetical protein
MFRPFTSRKQTGWYFSAKKKGTLPSNYFKMRYMKFTSSPLPSRTQSGILSRDIPKFQP